MCLSTLTRWFKKVAENRFGTTWKLRQHLLARSLAPLEERVTPAITLNEPFVVGGGQYTVGNLSGQGPANPGFAGGSQWYKSTANDPQVSGAGLSYSGLVTSGGSVSVVNNARASRELDTTVQANSGSNVSFYARLLVNLPTSDAGSYRAFEMHDGDPGGLPDGNRVLQLGQNLTDFGNANYGLRLFNNNSFRLDLGAVNAGQTDVFVIKFTLSSVNNGDSVTVWRNPAQSMSEPGGGLTLSNFNLNFDRAGFANFGSAGAWGFDEFRFATTWAEVGPQDLVPPGVTLSSPSMGTVLGSFTVNALFTEPVTGFDASDVSVTNGTVSGFSGGGANYSFTVTPTAAGNVGVSVAAGVAIDGANNPNTASNTLSRYAFVAGGELAINTTTAGDQAVGGGGRSVAVDAAGNALVVWQSPDGSGYGIFGQRLDATGAKVGGEFQVNTTTTSNQLYPSVALDSDGDAVVVWQSYGQDGSGWGIFGQRYDAAGAKVGGEFQVNTYTTSFQLYPSVALDSDGDAVVVWMSYGQDGSGWGIFGQRYNAAGAKVGVEFQVNTYTTGSQLYPSVALDSDGDAVVVWVSLGQDGSGYGIFGQRYNAAGAKVGVEFQVNTYTTGSQSIPSVALDSDGDAVVVWQSFGQDGSGYGNFGQRYNAAGAKVGGEFQINTYTTNGQINPSVALDSDGDALVVWMSFGQDGSFNGIYGQRYNAAGAKVGGEFQVNTYTTSDQRFPSVALDSDGDAVVVWQSSGQDGSGEGIYGRRIASPNPSTGSLSAALSGNDVLVTDTAGVANNLTVSFDGTNYIITDAAEQFQGAGGIPGAVLSNGNKTLTIPAASFSGQLVINGSGGNDTLIVLSGTTFNRALSYDGGLGDDALGIRGAGTQVVVYTPDSVLNGKGLITVNGQTIAFQGLEPVDFDNVGTFTLSLPNAADSVTVTNGFNSMITGLSEPAGTVPALIFSGTSGGVGFEQAHVFRTTNVVIDTTANDGVDTITIASANNAHKNANLTITTGAGADSLTVNGAVVVGGTFTANVPTVNLNDNITAGSITGTATVVNVDDAPAGEIGDAVALAASGATINVAAGTYSETVAITKPVTIDGQGVGLATVTINSGSNQSLFSVGAANVVIRDLVLNVNRPNAAAGITAIDPVDFTGLQILNNTITSIGAAGSPLSTPFGNTAAAGIALLSNSVFPFPVVTIQGNTINGTSPTSFFSRGIWLRQVQATVGGAGVGQGNSIFATTQDLLFQFASTVGPAQQIEGNAFLGAGVDLTEPNPGTVNVVNNQFTPVSPAFAQSLLIKHNYVTGSFVVVDGNNFAGHGNFAIISGSSHNVAVTNNSFTPATGAANFTHVLMSTSYPTGGVPFVIPDNSLTLQGNVFNGAAGANGRGFVIQNGQSFGNSVNFGTISSGFGSVVVGGAGPLANTFNIGMTEFIHLSPATFVTPTFSPNPNKADVTVSFNAAGNLFNVGSGAKLPAAMNQTELYALEDRIVHRVDVGTLGVVTVTPGSFHVTPNSFVAPVTTTPNIQRAVDAASNGDTINIQAGTYTGAVSTAAKNLNLAPSTGPSVTAQVTNTGPFTLDGDDTVTLDINGTNPASQFDNFITTAALTVGGTLALAGSHVPAAGDSFVILSGASRTGTFAGLPNGTAIPFNGKSLFITYTPTAVILNASSLNVFIDGSGNLVINDAVGLDDDITVRSDVANNRFVIQSNHNLTTTILGATGNGTKNMTIPFAAVTGPNVLVTTQGGIDTVTVDLSLGNFAKNVGYAGGAGVGDRLNIVAGAFDSIVGNYLNANDGNFVLDPTGADPAFTVSYTGLEPVLLNVGTVTDVVFNLPAGGSNAFLEDDGTTGNTLNRLRSSPVTFETTDFVNPTGSLTINRGNAADSITINALPDFNATLTLGASGFEFATVTFTGPVTLAAGNHLTAFGQTISLSTATADLATSGSGSIGLTATRNVALASGSSLAAVDGAIVVQANVPGTAPAGNFVGIELSNATITTSGTGSINLNGRSTGQAGTVGNIGINLLTGSIVQATGSGSITLTGKGGAGTDDNAGVALFGATVSAAGGNIAVNGFGGTAATGSRNRGIDMLQDSLIQATGSGSILLSGVGGAGTDLAHGVTLSRTGGAAPRVVTADGALTVLGSASAASSSGVRVAGDGKLETNNGLITVDGSFSGSSDRAVDLTVSGGFGSGKIKVNGTGTVLVVGDSMFFDAGTDINAGANLVTLRQRTNGTQIKLGGADGAGTLGLTDAELDTITAGTLRIGDANSGAIAVVAPISIAPAKAPVVHLQSGSTITGTAASFTAQSLALEAAGAINFSNAGNDVTTVAIKTTGANAKFADATGFDIGTVDGVVGINVGGANVSLSAGGAVTDTDPVVAAGLALRGTGSYTLDAAGFAIGTLAADTTGSVTLVESTGFDVGTVLGVTGVSNVVTLTITAGGAVTDTDSVQATNVLLRGAGPYTLDNSANDWDVLASDASGAVTVADSDGFSIGTVGTVSGVNIGTNTLKMTSGGAVTQTQVVIAANVGLVGAGPFLLTLPGNDADTIAANVTGVINFVDADGLTVGIAAGLTGITSTVDLRLQTLGGNLTVAEAISTSGTARLVASGSVSGTAPGVDVTAAAISFTAATGVTLDTQAATLAGSVTGAGAINLVNNGSTTIGTVKAFSETETGLTAANGAINVLVAKTGVASSLTVAEDVTATGAINLTVGEVFDFPTCNDDLIVAAGATVKSTAGNVILRAGDDIWIQTGALVDAFGSLELTAGFNDVDNCGDLILDGNIKAGANIDLCAVTNINVGGITSSGTVTLYSMKGSIIDNNGPLTNVTAPALAMQAAKGIGTPLDHLETKVGAIEATDFLGGIYVDNDTPVLNVGGVIPGCGLVLNGVNAKGPGDVLLTNTGDLNVALTGEKVSAAAGNVDLQAGGDVNLGSASGVGQVTASGNVGVTSTGGGLTLTNGSFIKATTGDVNATVSGDITLDDFNAFGGYLKAGQDVNLLANGTITVSPNGSGGVFAGDDVTMNAAAILLADRVLAGDDVSLTSNTGDITDTTPNGVRYGLYNTLVQGDLLTVTSAGKVNLDTDVNSLTVSANGPVTLRELNTAAVNSITAVGALITLSNFNGASTFTLVPGDALENSSTVEVQAGTLLDLNGDDETIGALQGLGNVALGNQTLTTGGNNASTVFNGVISGIGGNVFKDGAGVFTLGGSNTYTGTTKILNGTVKLGASNVLADASSLVVQNPSATFDMNGKTETVFAVTLVNGTIAGPGTLTSQTTYDVRNGLVTANLAGSVGLVKGTGGTVELAGVNTYTGNSFINGGTLKLSGSLVGPGSDVFLNANGVVLDGAGTGKITARGVVVNAGKTNTFVQGLATLTNSGTTTGLVINKGASASVLNNTIQNNQIGILVDGGTALIQGNNLSFNTKGDPNSAAGLVAKNNAIVDAGQNPSVYYTHFTGLAGGTGPLGASQGLNVFSGYPYLGVNDWQASVPKAIRNLNIGGVYSLVGPQFGTFDLTAMNNTFDGSPSLFLIEKQLYHDIDTNGTLGFITYGNSTTPATMTDMRYYAVNPTLTYGSGPPDFTSLTTGNPTGVFQASSIRRLRTTYDGYVFIDMKAAATALPIGGAVPGVGGVQIFKKNGPALTFSNTSGFVNVAIVFAAYDQNTGAYTTDFAFSNPPGQYLVEPNGSLTDGNYDLALINSLIQGGGPGGAALTNSPAPVTRSFHRFFGDFNGDRRVNNTDLAAMQAALGSFPGAANYRGYFNFDTIDLITGADYTAFVRRYRYLLNLDGTTTLITP